MSHNAKAAFDVDVGDEMVLSNQMMNETYLHQQHICSANAY
jgi:hypothetical protein